MQIKRNAYEHLLMHQQAQQQDGVILYEKGLEIVSISGTITSGVDCYYVYADPTRLFSEQPCTTIPLHRMIEMRTEPATYEIVE